MVERSETDAEPPSWGMDLRAVADGIDDRRSRAVIDLTMRVAESALTTGASAAEVTAMALRLTSAYGLTSVHVDVTYTSITVSHHRGAEADPVTMMRTVRSRSEDYDRLIQLDDLVSEIARVGLSPQEARGRFDEIVARPRRYRSELVAGARGMLAGGVATLLGGSVQVILVAVLTSVVVGKVIDAVQRWNLSIFFAQVAGGAIPTAVAVALVTARSAGVPGLELVSPSLVVASGIVALLAGMAVVGAAQDAIDGYYVTAGARAFQVVVLTMGLVAGILAVLGLGQRLGVPTYIIPAGSIAGSVVVQIAAAGVIAAGHATSWYAPPRTVLASLAAGVLGWSTFVLAGASGLGAATASAVAGLLVGFFAQFVAGRSAVRAPAVSTAGIVALLPGLMVFRGLYQLVEESQELGLGAGLLTLSEAAAIGLGLAGGVSLGGFIGGRWRQRGDRFWQRAMRRASSGS